MSHKYFTLSQANKTLPLVKRIVADLTSLHPRWRDLVYRYELIAAQAKPEWGESPEQLALRAEIEALARQINDYLVELDQVGCVFKGFEAGLVDFYSLREDRPIFLCWRLGEERITHWHEVESGFAGRQPIDRAILSATPS